MCLYEALAFRLPTDGASSQKELVEKKRRLTYRQLAEDAPYAPYALRSVLYKAIQPDPDLRYDNAESFADDLKRFIEDKPVRARGPSWWREGWAWAKHHRDIVVAGLAVVVLGATIAAALTRMAYVSKLAKQSDAKAEEASRRAAAIELTGDVRPTIDKIMTVGSTSSISDIDDLIEHARNVLDAFEHLDYETQDRKELERFLDAAQRKRRIIASHPTVPDLDERWKRHSRDFGPRLDFNPENGKYSTDIVPIGTNEAGHPEFLYLPTYDPESDGPIPTYRKNHNNPPRLGIVLVGIPGHRTKLGKEVIRRYLISKYELTNDIWRLLSGISPVNRTTSSGFPARGMSFRDAYRVLRAWGLNVPASNEWVLANDDDEIPPGNEGTINEDALNKTRHLSIEYNNQGESQKPSLVDKTDVNFFGVFGLVDNVSEWCCRQRLSDIDDDTTVEAWGANYWMKSKSAFYSPYSAKASHETVGVRPAFVMVLN